MTNTPTPPRPDEAPAPPWRATPDNGNNAKRAGWEAFFAGKRRDACPFPPAFHELHRAYQEGWDAAKEAPASSAPEPEDEAVARLIAAIDDFEADADDAHEAGENVATWDEVVEVDISDLRLALSALASRAEEIAALREALEPFAHYYELNDLHERCGDDAIEVPVRDLRRAVRALTPGETPQ